MDIASVKTSETQLMAGETGMEAVPDDVAVHQIRNGDARAFETVMRRYNQRLYRIARSILYDSDAAEDAVQQAYISAYYKLDSYTPTNPFGAWLTRITINEALMMKRRSDNRIVDKKESLDNEAIAGTNNNPETIHANRELAALIESAIERLPEEFRYVFVLRAIQQLSTKETAESLDISDATVKTRFHRARLMMQRHLNGHIQQAGMHVFEFAGKRCDQLVRSVLERLWPAPS